VRVLTGVTLGLAKAELDSVAVRLADRVVLEVLRVSEVKRNPNDVGYAVSRGVETLGFLCGLSDKYDPDEWKTRTQPRGHFEHPVEHDGLVFSPDSFQAMRREWLAAGSASCVLPPRFHVVTKPGNVVNGITSKAADTLRRRVAETLRPDDAFWHSLFDDVHDAVGPVDAVQAIRLFERHAPDRLHLL